jgi:hypothetical protein
MGLLNRLFGFRWSLYVVTDGNVLHYAMNGNSVMYMLGYVMGRYADGGRPVPPWSLHLNFNRKQQAFELLPEHFSPDGKQLSQSLIRKIESIDPGWSVAGGRLTGGEPVFEELPSRRQIKVNSIADWTNPDKIMEYMRALAAGAPEEETFFRVMDRVFGRASK